jgi:hypothetical protein
MQTLTTPRFPLGLLVITENAEMLLTQAEISQAINRHAQGDWGDVSPIGGEANDQALLDGNRLFSAFGNGERRFWIITEANRSATTVLMPEDY